MRRTKTTLAFFIALILFIALVVGISRVQKRMNRIRVEEKLTAASEPLLNAPPMVAFTTVALGGFRGLLADWLWLRSRRMQDDGNYFEMYQLGSWIVKLQPRFTGAAAFLAWNMAYNISVTFSSYEDRWRWVQRGIELLRDEALVYNPGDPELFRELGWIFQHKLGKDLDDANRHYKTEWAFMMIKTMGEEVPDWQALAGSPVNEAGLRVQLGEESELWPILTQHNLTLTSLEEGFREEGTWPLELDEDLTAAGLERSLELYFRHRWLLQVYKLDPQKVLTYNRDYGELDWRLPEAHAIYWARRGLEAADREMALSCDRMIFQSLNAAFKGGRLVYVKDIKHLEMTPNIDIVAAVNQSYLDAMEKHGENIIRGGYENFLVDATVILYTFGRQKQAKEYFEKGREFYGRNRFYRNVDEFVLQELAGDMAMASYDQAQGTIRGYLLQACHALATGQQERAAALEIIARKLWQKYMLSIGDTAQRRGLPPYAQMKATVVQGALSIFPAGLTQQLRRMLPEADTLNAPAAAGDQPDQDEL